MTKAREPIPSLRLCWPLALLALLLCCALASTASADISFGGTGSGAGQLTKPQDIAVDNSNGHVYVADQDNNRVDVFDSAGTFLYAFGWGVADGTSPELQSCTTTCFEGLEGGGAGEFTGLRQIAVDNNPTSSAYHDVYTFDGSRVQRFTPTGEFLRAWGGGVITGGAKGTGNLSSGSATITNVQTTQKAFERGQTITGAGIPANTRIVGLGATSFGDGTITLSNAATASGTGVALSVAEGAGNVPLNEKQLLTITYPESIGYELEFVTPNPSPSSESTGLIFTGTSSAATIQSALEGLSNIGPGNVAVSGPIGGPFTIEFKGTRFADTDVRLLGGSSGSGSAIKEAVQNGAASAELCTPANADACTAGAPRCESFAASPCANVLGSGIGQFESIGGLVVGPSGAVYVADSRDLKSGISVVANRVQSFEPSGAFATQFEPLGGDSEGVDGLALDSAGNSYVATDVVRKYDPTGTLLTTLDPTSDSAGGFVQDLGIDAADNVFVGASTGTVEYDSAAAIQRVLYGIGGHPTPYHSAGGDLFGLSGNQVLYTSFPPPGPAALKGEATAIGNVKATLNASLNPEGKSTTYHFQYVDQKGFEEAGYASPKAKTTAESAPVGSDFKLKNNLSATITGLTPETTYHFRLVATNADAVVNAADATFKTLEALEFEGTWLTEVGVEEATIHGALDPLGIAATGSFQYVDDATYQQSGFAEALEVPNVVGGQSPLNFGSGVGKVTRSAVLYPLTPATTYHYRLIAKDSFGTFIDAERTFRTFPPVSGLEEGCPNQGLRAGPSAPLPDCRAYEMVSPLDKNSGDILATKDVGGNPIPFYQSAADGNGLTYSSFRAFGGAQSAPYVSQYLAHRGAAGWSTEAISPPRQGALITDIQSTGIANEYQAFSPDLSTAWLFHDTEPPLAPGAVEAYVNLYRRDNASGGYEALTAVEPPHHPAPFDYIPLFEGASDDGSHAVFMAKDKLTPDARNTTSTRQLYEYYNEGLLRLVSVMPDGSASKASSSAGAVGLDGGYQDNRYANALHAISADGSRIFWTAGDGPSKQLYVRIDGERTVAISEALGAGEATFWLADPAGTKAIFTLNGSLYEFAVDAEEAHLIASGVAGVIGAGEDASRVYFVSSAVLSGEEENSEGAKAQLGARNVYLYEAPSESFTYVTTLAAGPDENVFSRSPYARASRVSADGMSLTFVSQGSLTGYDNHDTRSGEADGEAYLYQAGAKRLICASCNPTGSRPSGRYTPSTHNGYRYFAGWFSGMFPGWQSGLYAQHVLSEDGSRLFFESFDALVPRDTNGQMDIYEWEAPGAGSCEEESTAYFAANEGCLYLISTGQSPGEVEFVDVTPDGSDVFFTTGSSLVPQDYGLVDVYDARANGGYPPPGASPAICEGEACQSPPTPPNDPTPASSAYEGPGNPVAAKKKAKKKKAKHKKHQRKQARDAKHDRRGQR